MDNSSYSSAGFITDFYRLAWAYLIVFLSGLLCFLVFEPYNYWFLVFIYTPLIFLVCSRSGKKEAAILGFIFGVGFFSVFFVGVISALALIDVPQIMSYFIFLLAVLVGSATCSVKFLLISWIFTDKRANTHIKTLCPPLFWLFFEYIRSEILGLPWYMVGYTAISNWLSGWYPVIGVYGVSLIILIGASLVMRMMLYVKKYFWVAGLYFILAFSTGFFFSKLSFVDKLSDSTISVALVQTNAEQESKWDGRNLVEIESHFKDVLNSIFDTELIVFPEMTIPAYLFEMDGLVESFKNYSIEHDSFIILGMATSDSEGRAFNSAVGIGSDISVYNKKVLFPFWEYTPENKVSQYIGKMFSLPNFGYSSGEVEQLGLYLKNSRLGGRLNTIICYESFFTSLVRNDSLDANAIVMLSNDSWLVSKILKHQSLQVSRVRAAENRRFMVRSTQDGITAIIDPYGRILNKAPVKSFEILKGDIYLLVGETPYQKFGQWPLLALILPILLYFLVEGVRKAANKILHN